MQVKFRKKSQITLPMAVVEQLELKEGDKMEVEIINQTVCLTPFESKKRKPTETADLTKKEYFEKNNTIKNNSKLYFECLGHFAIYNYGKLVLLSNKKAEELIAFLICERGYPVLKETIATFLWPQAEKRKSMECLYKVWKYICNLSQMNIEIPIISERNHMYFNSDDCVIDLEQFESYYENRRDIRSCEAAIQLYRGPLYYHQCYNWISQWEAYYEIRFWKLIEVVIEYYQRKDMLDIVEKYRNLIAKYEC